MGNPLGQQRKLSDGEALAELVGGSLTLKESLGAYAAAAAPHYSASHSAPALHLSPVLPPTLVTLLLQAAGVF